MKNEPLVTISTPCYNHEKYLPDYFDSIITQTYENIELIIIDDASQDNSQKVIEKYLPKLKKRFTRVRYIPRNKNVGLVRNCNEGLDLAQGKYIIGFASDDIMLPTRVEENVKFLEEHKDYDMVYSDGYRFNVDIDIKTINFNNLVCFSDRQKLDSDNIMNQLLIGCFIDAPTACIRKNCFNIVGRYDENYYFEDYDMFLKIAEQCKIGYLNKKLVLYRIHSKSMSHDKRNRLKELEEVKKIKSAHIRNGNYDQKYIELAWVRLWEEYANYFFTNNKRAESLEYFHKYMDSSKKYKLKIGRKMFIEYLISLNSFLYKIFFHYIYSQLNKNPKNFVNKIIKTGETIYNRAVKR
jgi:glycosyltransferase involved in cell wall biosynthesis